MTIPLRQIQLKDDSKSWGSSVPPAVAHPDMCRDGSRNTKLAWSSQAIETMSALLPKIETEKNLKYQASIPEVAGDGSGHSL
jgi:hypothetical protein